MLAISWWHERCVKDGRMKASVQVRAFAFVVVDVDDAEDVSHSTFKAETSTKRHEEDEVRE